MISFACSSCGRVISVDQKYSGKKGKCPKCGGIVVVPEQSTIIKFHCESCGHKIKVPDKYGGKKGKCPKCHKPILIPPVEKNRAVAVEMTRVTCQMCGQTIEVPQHASEAFTECPSCGSYIETSFGDAVAESDILIPPPVDEQQYEEESEEYEESEGIDRRLIVTISAVAVVVGLVILVAVLKLSRPRPQQQFADTSETITKPELDEAKAFAERYISLLENGEVDEALQLHNPELADDTYKLKVERLSGQIGKSRIIEMNCTRTQREQYPEGERVSLWYNLRYEEGAQTVNITVLRIEQELKIDGITAQDSYGNSFSIKAKGFAELPKTGRTIERRRTRPSPGKFYFALAVGLAIGSFFSACCLWVGMKVTNVGGTFIAMLGIALISSLAHIVPVFIGLMPCVGWLMSLIVMLILICQWTDAELWPEAIGIVVIAAVVGILVQIFLDFLISMA
ncbi:MAG: hypothetical protein ACYSTT_06570 [Planctomycetota bacterium]|jgi:predicted RNA-binding Zn-ribbon protein involved in translation (DUF1610 family)